MLTTQTVVKPVSFKGRTFEVQYDEMRNGSSSVVSRHANDTASSVDHNHVTGRRRVDVFRK